MRVYVVRKWPLRGRNGFVYWNITRVSLWLLCNVHSVQSIRPTIATWPRWPKDTDHCSSEEYRCIHIDACVARIWISYRCVPCHPWCTHWTSLGVKKNFFSFPVAVNNFIKVGPLVFLVWIFVITEKIMKRPVYSVAYIPLLLFWFFPLLPLKNISPILPSFPGTVLFYGFEIFLSPYTTIFFFGMPNIANFSVA